MTRVSNLAVLVLAALLVTGCGDRDRPAKTVDYFLQHPDEIRPTERDCENRGISPLAEGSEARTCNAAFSAEQRRFFGNKK